MGEVVLCVNAGSSSLKFARYQGGKRTLGGQVSGLRTEALLEVDGRVAERFGGPMTLSEAAEQAARLLAAGLDEVDVAAVCHRIVHGGDAFAEAQVLGPKALERLKDYISLAPLHQPHALEIAAWFAVRFPGAATIGCFDTAFHASLPEAARVMALPPELRARGLRRYGFHGLAYKSVTGWLKEQHPDVHAGRAVALHLGSGASLCALKNGRSVATTMGATALDGVPMATRSGAVDPGALTLLLKEEGLTANELEEALYRRSGLLGISGRSGDMRVLREADDEASHLAIEHFVLRVAEAAGAMMTHLGGADALVFSGGIGQNDVSVREAVAERLAFAKPFDVLVHEVDEEAVMAGEAESLLRQPGAGA